MKFGKPKQWLIGGVILLAISPVALCLWVYIWPAIQLRMSLRIYPHAQQVSEAYGYYGASSGLKVLYYRTEDPKQDVQKYYETFTAPFVTDRWNGSLITVYSIDGSKLLAYEVVGPPKELDYSNDPRCHYTMINKCVNISLFSIDQNLESLPELVSKPGASSADNATPYLAKPLKTGTLIVLSYYRADF